MLRLRPRLSIGLDLGSHTLKVAEVVAAHGQLRITRIGAVRTPPGAVSDGAATDPQALGSAVRALLKDAAIRSKRVVTALGSEAVVIRTFSFPEMPPGELEEAVTLEAERYLAEGAGEVRRTYQVLDRSPADGQLQVLVAATGKALVDRHMAPLTVAGLTSTVMEATPFSILRAVARHNGSDAATVYVDLGAQGSHVLIVEHERIRLARHFAFGGNALTNAIAERLSLDTAAAEALKERRAQMPPDGGPPDDGTRARLHEAILPVITRLVTELRRSLDFYLARLDGHAISTIILTGGTAKLKNLAPFLSGELGLPVEIGNPFSACETDTSLPPGYLANVAPAMAVAVGLALRGAQRDADG